MISFNQVPSNLRTPFVYVEFDNSNANQGPSLQVYRALVIGQKLASGTAPADIPVRVTSAEQAVDLFGVGSMLSHMFEKWFVNNSTTEVWGMPLSDNGAGVEATSTITITGPATAAGQINLYVGGRKVQSTVLSSDTATQIAAALVAKITADTTYPVSAANTLGVVTLTHKHKGVTGNELDVRLNYFEGEVLPTGVGAAIVAMASGSANPVLTTAIAAMADTQYHVIAHPYVDTASLLDLETELTSRAGPLEMIEGLAFTASNRSHSALLTLGNGRNSAYSSISGCFKYPTAPYEVAAVAAALVALHGAIDQARPFQTLSCLGVLPPKAGERFTRAERNLLLFDGISTSYIDDGGVVRLERMITTYQTNAFSAPDPSYLDVNTLLTLSYLSYDFRTYFLSKYPRHKLASDGTRVAPGQAIITPKVGKAEAIKKFRDWQDLGLVENIEQFKADLIVERSLSDVNRLNFYLPPDIINQLIVTAVKIGFRL